VSAVRKFSPGRWLALAALILVVPLFGCGMRSTPDGFASYPGFAAYFTAHPPSDKMPTEAEARLLRRYRPTLFLPPGHAGPIDFYADYLPYTRMVNLADQTVLAQPPSRDDLIAHQEQFTASLERVTEPDTRHPTVYARIRQEVVSFPHGDGQTAVPLTFLTYTVPFAHSGLPAKLGRMQGGLISLAEALLGWQRSDWHPLDVYTAYTLVLTENLQPFAVLLAQHNHHRSYLIGKDLIWPKDDHLALDVAISSNELYLSSGDAAPVAHRTIPFFSELDYLLSGSNPPLAHGWDITHGPNAGGTRTPYRLGFLPPSDPFYTFKGWLGDYRPFMGFYVGRSGSPGADYYTIPALLPLGNTLKFSYLQDGDEQDIAAVRRHIDGFNIDIDAMMDRGGRTLWANWTARTRQ